MKKSILFIAAVFLAIAALSCDFPQSPDGGKGYLTVLMAAEAPGGLYGKSSSELSGGSIASLTYKLTFTGPGGPVEQTARGGSASVALEPGEWNIEAKAYDSSGNLAGTGSAAASIAAGQPNTVALKMYVDSAYAASLTDIYIHSEQELRDYISLYDDGAVTFHLENNITVNAPVGDLLGNFDGHGHTVTLNIAVTGSHAGLFRTTHRIVKNLKLEGAVSVTYNAGGMFAGAVAAVNSGTIMNVASTASVTATCTSIGIVAAGGIAGNNMASAYIEQCSSGGDVQANQPNGAGTDPNAGGIAGDNAGTINSCYAYGNASSTNDAGWVGGIAGYNSYHVLNCAALNSKVYNDSTSFSLTFEGRVAGGSSYSGSPYLDNNHAYESMQIHDPSQHFSITPSPSSKHGDDIAALGLSSPSSDAGFWNESTLLNWPPFQPGPSASEPPPGSSPWYWSKTISIPGNLVNGSGVSPVYVPALWFE